MSILPKETSKRNVLLSSYQGFARRSTVETLVIMIALIFAAGTFTYQLAGESPMLPPALAGQTSTSTQIVRGVAYLAIIMVCLQSSHSIIAILKRSTPLTFLVFLAMISATWSPDPVGTVRKATALMLTLFTGICLAAHYPGFSSIRIVLRTYVVMLTLSVIVVVVAPRYGIHQVTDGFQSSHAGQWRGIFVHRTLLGQMAGFSAAILISCGSHLIRARGILVTSIAISLLCLVMANSGGGYLTFSLVLLTYFIIKNFPKSMSHGEYALLFAIAAFVVLPMLVYHDDLIQLILSALGKETTLTGRTPIWQSIVLLWQQRPLLGYGFSLGFSKIILPYIETTLNTGYVPNAQNGYLQALICLGLVGLMATLWMLWVALRRSFSAARYTHGLHLAPLLVCIYFIQVNFVEDWLVEEHNPALILFATVFAAVASMDVRQPSSVSSTLRRFQPRGLLMQPREYESQRHLR